MAHRYLSKREQQIMEIVHRQGEVAATDVEAALPDRPSNATVRTLLRTLEGKGLLERREDGPRYLYRATAAREVEGRSALRRVLDTFYGGSLATAVSQFVAAEPSEAELAEIERMIREARR